MSTRRPDDVRAWLAGEPSLDALKEAFPEDWSTVQHDLAAVVPRGPRALGEYVQSTSAANRRERRGRDAHSDVRHRMAVLAARSLSLAAATGVTDGHVRLNRINGTIAQWLLFEQGLVRKPVALRRFRLLWPLLWQRRFLMPLVAPKGIYCFYSKPLIERMAALIGDRECVEIAAGDGTLTRFLAAAGASIVATDDHSWKDVAFPDAVIKEDARESLRRRRPRAVVCSWPPAGNAFEREVFSTDSVELYVVVSSRHRFAAGDGDAYEAQETFAMTHDEELSRLVLPPELEAAVYVFRRVGA
ncbi:hypothetical protein [Solirubrobacter soli]|uniref:hypothetical protein n=1 Tax=Solirubrobacter soli TaxID=363832 RepID=UPI0004230E6D|nr:hypothetical protein [Solirubrobacter soli]